MRMKGRRSNFFAFEFVLWQSGKGRGGGVVTRGERGLIFFHWKGFEKKSKKNSNSLEEEEEEEGDSFHFISFHTGFQGN